MEQKKSIKRYFWIIVSILITPMILASPKQYRGLEISALPGTLNTDFHAGFAALEQNKYMSANRLFTRLTEEQPDNPVSWLALSFASTSNEQFNAVVRQASKLRDKATNDEKILIDIQNTYVSGDSEKRKILVDKLTKKNPESSFAWWMSGNVSTDMKDAENARIAFVKANDLAPDFVMPLLDLGNNYLFEEPKNFKKAEKVYSEVARIQPANAFAHIGLGDARRAQKRLNDALVDYHRAALIDPTYGTAFTKKGHVNTFLGNYDNAQSDYQRAIETAEAANSIFLGNYKAFTYLYQDQPKKSVASLQKWVEKIDKMPVQDHQKVQGKIFTLNNLARIQIHTGDVKGAEGTLEQREALVERQISEADDRLFNRWQRSYNHYWQGMLQVQRGELTTAEATADKMYQLLQPVNNPRKLESYHELKGFISLRSEQWTEAVAHFDKANKDKVYVKYHKAMALEQAGDKKQAFKLYTEVKDYNFNSADYALVRGEAIEKSRFLTAMASR